MLTAKLDHVETVEEFYREIRSQQEAHHGADYCAMHDAMRKLMKECKSYKEIGTHQGGSAAAILSGEYLPFCEANNIRLVVQDVDSSSLASMSGEVVDMLMIDSLHKRYHMEKELKIHAGYARKYIVAHDTSICQDSAPDALFQCLTDFCAANPGWKIIERGTTNVGYTVLKKD